MGTLTSTTSNAMVKAETSPLITELAADWKLNPSTMINTLKATIFPQRDQNGNAITVANEQVVAFLQVCHTYKLNPFVKEIYAFPNKSGGFVPMVPIDGWSNIINRNAQMDGIEFVDEWETHEGKARSLFSTTCVIYRKDRSRPIRVTEYMQECYQPTKSTWKQWPARMLRHKAMIQCARVAFSLAGIFDPDEAERIAEVGEDKPAITRPTRASEAVTIDAPTPSSAPAAVEQKGEAVPAAAKGPAPEASPKQQAQASPATPTCFCACCKNGQCACASREEFERCGCPTCKQAVTVALSPKTEAEPEAALPAMADTFHPQAAANQPTGSELFPAQGQKSKPDGPYVGTKKLQKLIVTAKASGIDIKKDSHDDDLHKMLLQAYGIVSLNEIPERLYDDILRIVGEKLAVRP